MRLVTVFAFVGAAGVMILSAAVIALTMRLETLERRTTELIGYTEQLATMVTHHLELEDRKDKWHGR